MPGLRKRTVVVAAAAGLSLLASGCAGWGGGGGGGGPNSINVLMVNNPQMVDLQKLTADNFTAETGITVNYTVLPENDVRDKISQEFSSQAGQYDVASLSNFEIPIYAGSKWIAPLDGYIAPGPGVRPGRHPHADDRVAVGEDGKVYGEPFYGESSFLMYRKDVLGGQGHRRCRPSRPGSRSPTSRRKVDGAQPGMARHLPARPARLGPGLRPADHRGEHLRRHLVHRGLAGAGQRAGVHGGDQVLRRPGPRARRERRPAGRVHRVPEQPRPGQRRDVVRRDVGRRVAGGRGLAGQGQDRLRAGAGREDRRAPAGSTPGRGASRRPARRRTTPGSSSPGRPARSTRSSSATQLGWSRVPAGKRASTYENPDVPQGGRGVRRADPSGDRAADPREPGRAAAAGDRHPVRRHPRVPRARHAGLPGRQLGDRRADERRRGAGTRARNSPTTSPSATSSTEANDEAARRTVRTG